MSFWIYTILFISFVTVLFAAIGLLFRKYNHYDHSHPNYKSGRILVTVPGILLVIVGDVILLNPRVPELKLLLIIGLVMIICGCIISLYGFFKKAPLS